MPIIESKYHIKGLHSSMHYSTIYNNTLRKIDVVYDKRERVELSDGDFIDVDWKFAGNKTKKLIITLHGLEGDTSSKYMLGMAKQATQNGYDILGINHRGCSGEPNRTFKAYHAGSTNDIHEVAIYALNKEKYDAIYLNGFSISGNMVLLYIATHKNIPAEIKGAVAVSSPNHLKACCVNQSKLNNRIYAINFILSMKKKLKQKMIQFPNEVSKTELNSIKSMTDFDQIYTARAHGFDDAFDYYEKCSSANYLQNIKIPTLLLNAKNDTFLSPKCFPYQIAKKHHFLHLETPKVGGHLGFHLNNEITYNEKRALEFFSK